MARSESRAGRDCVHHGQDRTAHRAARWCNRSPITWHHCQRATIRTLSSFRREQAQSARHTLATSSATFSLTQDSSQPREHTRRRSKDRSHAREASEISFHSLRHSAVTMLKAAGVSDFIAREIVGHDSTAVSRQYTHLTTDDQARRHATVAGRDEWLTTLNQENGANAPILNEIARWRVWHARHASVILRRLPPCASP